MHPLSPSSEYSPDEQAVPTAVVLQSLPAGHTVHSVAPAAAYESKESGSLAAQVNSEAVGSAQKDPAAQVSQALEEPFGYSPASQATGNAVVEVHIWPGGQSWQEA